MIALEKIATACKGTRPRGLSLSLRRKPARRNYRAETILAELSTLPGDYECVLDVLHPRFNSRPRDANHIETRVPVMQFFLL